GHRVGERPLAGERLRVARNQLQQLLALALDLVDDEQGQRPLDELRAVAGQHLAALLAVGQARDLQVELQRSLARRRTQQRLRRADPRRRRRLVVLRAADAGDHAAAAQLGALEAFALAFLPLAQRAEHHRKAGPIDLVAEVDEALGGALLRAGLGTGRILRR